MTSLPHLGVEVTDHEASFYRIQWMRFAKDCPVPELVRTTPHLAFEVPDLRAAIKGKHVIIKPNSPSPGVLVAFIEENGVPIELLEITDRRAHARQRNKEKRDLRAIT